jgi:hypothetical protein
LADERVEELLKKLAEGVAAIRGGSLKKTQFTTVVLLDDFSASGRSYYMPNKDDPPGGKIAKFYWTPLWPIKLLMGYPGLRDPEPREEIA